MNTLPLAVCCAALVAARSFAEAPTQEELRNVKTVELATLDETPDAYVGKLVKIRFNYRYERIEKDKAGNWIGHANQYQYERKKNSGAVTVVIPEAGLDWFKRISTDLTSRKAVTVYARVTKPDGDDVQLELLGREAKTGTKGAELVW